MSFGRPNRDSLFPLPVRDVVKDSMPLLNSLVNDPVKMVFDDVNCQGDLVATSPELMNQVLINLCANAKDAIGDSAGVITVRVEEVNHDSEAARTRNIQPGNYVELSVSDDGSGISPDIIDRLQEPNFTTKPTGFGTGLGLWSVFGIVHDHGGEISVESELGIGTTFKIILPVSVKAAKVVSRCA